MQRTPVISSDLQSVGYNATTHTLEIEFTNGSVYQYSGVPESIYKQLMSVSSHGKYFHAYIKNIYPYKQVRLKLF